MTSGIEERALPEWINLGALTTPEEISRRKLLAARGMELLPALAAWIGDAAAFAERPPLLEVVDDTRELIYARMGVTVLADAVDRFRELVAVFEASGTELDSRLKQLRDGEDRGQAPAGAASEGALTGRWSTRRSGASGQRPD